MNTEQIISGTMECQRFWRRFLGALPILLLVLLGVVLAGSRIWGQVLVTLCLVAALILYFRLTEKAKWIRCTAEYTIENGVLTLTVDGKTVTMALADLTECIVAGANIWTSPCRIMGIRTQKQSVKLYSAPYDPAADPAADAPEDSERHAFGRLFQQIRSRTPQLVPQQAFGQEIAGSLVLPKRK